MDATRLADILNRFPELTVAVVGDFFLDQYLFIDPALSEISIETRLEAYQVVDKRCSPGAAGTVISNLHALGVGGLLAVGTIGDDGQGYELRRGLRERNVTLDYLVETPGRFTPTYTKPMRRQTDGTWIEMNRQDIKNRSVLPPDCEAAVLEQVRAAFARADGIVVMDQVEELNHGVVTDRIRDAIVELARSSGKPVLADSRARIADFTHVIIKPNQFEAARVLDPHWKDQPTPVEREDIGRRLFARNGRPVFMTAGEDGIYLFAGDEPVHVPGIPVTGPTDPVGAGDSVSAGIIASLCAGASHAEAALIGNLVASITVQQIGTTGTASPDAVRSRFGEQAARLSQSPQSGVDL